MTSNVVCAASTTQTRMILEGLREAGFNTEDVSVLIADQSSLRELGIEKHSKSAEGAVTGAGAGLVIGGALGWLAGLGMLAIPGLGPLIAAGPLLAALSSAAVVGTTGGVTGALVGMGIPEFEAKQYESNLRTGGHLISVHVKNHADINRAKHVFLKAGVNEVSTSS
jgi:hypothetical protein